MVNHVTKDCGTSRILIPNTHSRVLISMKLKLIVSAGGCFLGLEQSGMKRKDLKDLGFHMEPLNLPRVSLPAAHHCYLH